MKKTLDKYLGYLLVLLLSVMTLDVLWGVLTRYAFGSQADWSEELARFLLIWISLLGAAYASGQGMHLSIDLLMPKLTQASQRRLSIFIHVVILLFALTVMVIGGFRLMYVTQVLGQRSAALQVPMYLVYSVVPLSGVIIICYIVNSLTSPPPPP